MPNAAAPTTMLTVDVVLNVLGAVQASGLGAPAPAVHGPVLSAYAQVDATWPKRRVMEPVAVTVCPSWAFRVNHTGVDEVGGAGAEEDGRAGTVTDCPFTVMFWGVACSSTCTV